MTSLNPNLPPPPEQQPSQPLNPNAANVDKGTEKDKGAKKAEGEPGSKISGLNVSAQSPPSSDKVKSMIPKAPVPPPLSSAPTAAAIPKDNLAAAQIKHKVQESAPAGAAASQEPPIHPLLKEFLDWDKLSTDDLSRTANRNRNYINFISRNVLPTLKTLTDDQLASISRTSTSLREKFLAFQKPDTEYSLLLYDVIDVCNAIIENRRKG